MESALIVGSTKMAEAIGGFLVPRHCAGWVHAASGAKARRALSEREWELAILSTPLPDESAGLLAREIAHDGRTTVILLEDAEGHAPADGVITLAKPVNRILLEHTLGVVGTFQRRLAALGEENRKLAGKLEEARLMGRAKCALVAYKQMTEAQAHHYIEKQAMDSRLPRKEVARDILQMFEE